MDGATDFAAQALAAGFQPHAQGQRVQLGINSASVAPAKMFQFLQHGIDLSGQIAQTEWGDMTRRNVVFNLMEKRMGCKSFLPETDEARALARSGRGHF